MDVFFYGLFMDPAVLAEHQIHPAESRKACAEGCALRIGERATLAPADGARAYGMVHALTSAELDRLYAQPGLEAYRRESIVVHYPDGSSASAVCYNLPSAPSEGEANAAYAARLREVLTRLGFPLEYIRTVS